MTAPEQPRVAGLDGMVVSLSAKGLTHGEICAHLQEVYGADVSKQMISNITERVADSLAEWQNRPLDPVAGSPPATPSASPWSKRSQSSIGKGGICICAEKAARQPADTSGISVRRRWPRHDSARRRRIA